MSTPDNQPAPQYVPWSKHDDLKNVVHELDARVVFVEREIEAQDRRMERFIRESERGRAEIISRIDMHAKDVKCLAEHHNQRKGVERFTRTITPMVLSAIAILVAIGVFGQ